MRILDKSKTIELNKETCDMSNGYFTEEVLVLGQRPSLIETIQNPDGSTSTTKYDTLEITERVLIYNPFTAKDLYDREKTDLERWFETEYREQFEKCSRKIALGKKMRDGSDPHVKLAELYALAETNSNRINELREMLED